jgi:hypothetical protein
MKNHLAVKITDLIKSDDDLFEAFYGCLQFPDWFGFN